MAIAYDNSASWTSASGANPSTTYTMGSGANGILVVFVQNQTDTSDRVSGATFGGQAMTQMTKGIGQRSATYLTVFYLQNPPTGSQTLALTASDARYPVWIASWTGATLDDNTGTTYLQGSATTVTTFTTAITTNVNACWGVYWVAMRGTKTLSTNLSSTRLDAGNGVIVADSNGSLGNAGSYNLIVTQTDEWVDFGIGFGLAPSAGSSTSSSPSSSLSSSVSSSPSSSTSSSLSSSPSTSVSASPSPGYVDYSRYHYASLPTNDTDLTTLYSTQDYIDVGTDNGVYVSQDATAGAFTIHQFKNYADGNNSCTLLWNGQTDEACFFKTVYLQIYNRNTTTWDTVASNNATSADTDFDLTAYVSDLTNYKDGNSVISCRVWQQST